MIITNKKIINRQTKDTTNCQILVKASKMTQYRKITRTILTLRVIGENGTLNKNWNNYKIVTVVKYPEIKDQSTKIDWVHQHFTIQKYDYH